MKSITIHNFDKDLSESLLAYANLNGKSINQSVKDLLRKSFGLDRNKKKADFSNFCGLWTKEEAIGIDRALKASEQVNLKDWK